MAYVLRFVDKIDASRATRLDLNDNTNFKTEQEGKDFSPPPLKKARISSFLHHGSRIVAGAWENRFVRFQVLITGTSKDDLATKLQNLHRELTRTPDRDGVNNILEYQSDAATAPVFFRCMASPGYRDIGDHVLENQNKKLLDLEIEAEPFAYGLRVTQSPVTVNNDPAAGSNPCYFDVTGVTGDVPTPAFVRIDPSPSVTLQTLLASRRHGTPGGVYIFQAEGMTQGADTTVQANDAVMSGASNNYSRTTFATPTMATRLSTTAFPAAASVDIRGRYRLYVRIRKSVAGDVINLRAVIGDLTGNAFVMLPSVPIPTGTVFRRWIDLGIVSVPIAYEDPEFEGYSNVVQSVNPTVLQLQAERASGSGNLDWDVLVAVPADEELCIITHALAATEEMVADGPLDKVYLRTAGGQLGTAAAFVTRVGGLPMLSPNQTNRLAMILNVKHAPDQEDDKTWTSSVTISFWPRYLYVRPAST